LEATTSVARTGPARPLRSIALPAYPLYGVPQPWPVSSKELARATDISRIRENLIKLRWGDIEPTFAAILTAVDANWVALHLARLSEDTLEVVDIRRLEEDLLTPGEGKLFSESTNLLIDCQSGLAVGEYKPMAVGILGERPTALINHALHAAEVHETIDLKPFPSREFREIVLGKAIETYDIELGPLSATELENLGVTGTVVRRLVQKDETLAVKVKIQLDSHVRTDESKASLLERFAKALSHSEGKRFQITTEEYRNFDLLRNNLEKFRVPVRFDPKAPPRTQRDACLAAMRKALEVNRPDLLARVPQKAHFKAKKLDEFTSASLDSP
jgi:hypothetical protein